jgi:predicted ATPase
MRNFRMVTDTKLPLGPLTVMVGPDAAAKSNVLCGAVLDSSTPPEVFAMIRPRDFQQRS